MHKADSSLAATAYSAVRTRILRGELMLGQPISRRKLAAELGISFPPVTEALLRLELEGLLESRPRAGTRVCIPSREDVRGHYIVREALETQASLLCGLHATKGERKELERLAVRVDALSAKADRSGYVAVHLKLHQRIAEFARCEALTQAVERTQALASIWFCLMRKPSPSDSGTRHQELIETIFTIPGMGQYLFDSVTRRDYPVIQAIVLVSSTIVLLTNVLVDIAYARVDARVSYE